MLGKAKQKAEAAAKHAMVAAEEKKTELLNEAEKLQGLKKFQMLDIESGSFTPFTPLLTPLATGLHATNLTSRALAQYSRRRRQRTRRRSKPISEIEASGEASCTPRRQSPSSTTRLVTRHNPQLNLT